MMSKIIQSTPAKTSATRAMATISRPLAASRRHRISDLTGNEPRSWTRPRPKTYPAGKDVVRAILIRSPSRPESSRRASPSATRSVPRSRNTRTRRPGRITGHRTNAPGLGTGPGRHGPPGRDALTPNSRHSWLGINDRLGLIFGAYDLIISRMMSRCEPRRARGSPRSTRARDKSAMGTPPRPSGSTHAPSAARACAAA